MPLATLKQSGSRAAKSGAAPVGIITTFLQTLMSQLSRAGSTWQHMTLRTLPLTLIDIGIVAILCYWALTLIRETRAARMVGGIALLFVLFLLGRLLQLELLNWVLDHILAGLLIAIPIIFQPELRAALERLGRTQFVGRFGVLKHPEILQAIDDIVLSAETLANQHVGALLVIERQDSLEETIQTGTRLNAKLSFELLLTIFQPRTPLHDGAVIIQGNTITAASTTLPVFQGSLEYQLGTRHKAALALAQQTDAVSVVISEEKGTISLAYDRKIRFDLTADELRRALLRMLKERK